VFKGNAGTLTRGASRRVLSRKRAGEGLETFSRCLAGEEARAASRPVQMRVAAPA